MKAPRKPFDAIAKKAALFEILDATARHGKVCPKLGELGELLAIPVSRVDELMRALRDEGRITWGLIYFGPGVSWVRIVTITATGAKTGQPAPARTYWGQSKKIERVEPTQLDRAKTVLRRQGRVVHNAEITGGPKGLIRVDSREMKPAEVIALAQQAGVN